jgi:hypothetical protein
LPRLLVAVCLLTAALAHPQEEPAPPPAVAVEPFGYLKIGYLQLLPPRESGIVGANGGFRLLNARVGLVARPWRSLELVASIDGAAPERDPADLLRGARAVALKDAYAQWRYGRWVGLRIGQFKPPFNAEFLLPDAQTPFIRRSILTEGLLPPEGYPASPLGLDRDIGVELGSERLGGAVAVEYALAVVNGSGPNVLHDRDVVPMPVGRLAVHLGSAAVLGLGGYFDEATVGVSPDRFRERHLGYGVDLQARVGPVSLLATALGRTTQFLTTGLPSQQGLGAMVHAKLPVGERGLEVGARGAWLEPNTRQAADRVIEATAMVGYRSGRAPVRMLLEYTLRAEEPSAVVANDGLELMAQVTF